MFRKSTLAAALIGGFLLSFSAAPAAARDRNDCGQRIRKAEMNLDKAVRKHGEHSRQAEKRRREVEQARANCRGDEHRDRDHDRDRH